MINNNLAGLSHPKWTKCNYNRPLTDEELASYFEHYLSDELSEFSLSGEEEYVSNRDDSEYLTLKWKYQSFNTSGTKIHCTRLCSLVNESVSN